MISEKELLASWVFCFHFQSFLLLQPLFSFFWLLWVYLVLLR